MGIIVFSVSKRYIAFFLALVSFLVIIALLALNAKADVTIFNSGSYIEKGVETVDESGVENYVEYEYVWSDFHGVLPEESLINSTVLHLTWSLVNRSVSQDEPLNDTQGAQSDLLLDTDVPVEEVSTSELNNLDNATSSNDELEGEIESAVINTVQSTEIDISPEIEKPSMSEEEQLNEILTIPTSEIPEINTEIQGFEEVSFENLYRLANAQIEENVATNTGSLISVENEEDIVIDTNSSTSATNLMSPDVLITDAIATTSGFVSSDVLIKNVAEKFFEIRYSIDGVEWHSIGKVGFDDSLTQEFDISYIGLDMLPQLHIAIRYTIPKGDQTKIIFDNVYLALEHTNAIVEVTDEPKAVDESEPNFDVSSIKSDIQSENIRAVMLERGGVLELWYAIISESTGEYEWNRLSGGSAIDSDAPIAIKERTIFWIDRNQQTLFGFSVDEKSVFNIAFLDPEKKTFLLPFENEKSELWEVSFNIERNNLEFQKKNKLPL